jgi:hypothetical protein
LDCQFVLFYFIIDLRMLINDIFVQFDFISHQTPFTPMLLDALSILLYSIVPPSYDSIEPLKDA